MNYDIAIGIDNSTLNTVIAQVYHALYPNLLKSSINGGELGKFDISSVAFDINAAPTVSLAPSVAANAYFEATLADNTYGDFTNLDEDSKSTLLNLANAASFDLSVPSIALTINYTSGAPTSLSVSATGAFNIQAINQNGQNLLTVEILSVTISIPSDPDMSELLNRAVVPQLISYLNENILHPIKIPTLQYKSLLVSLPVPVVQTPYVTAYSALGSTQPDIPAPFNWPTGCVYIGLDAAALEAAARTEFPLGKSTGFSSSPFSGQAGVQVQAPNSIIINSDGSLTATLTVNASAQLTWHTPDNFPNLSLGPSATATLTPTLRPSVNNGELELGIQGVTIPSFSFDWGIPEWASLLFDAVEAALNAALNAVLQNLLSQMVMSIHVVSLPPIRISYKDTEINITLNNATTSCQNSLWLISLQATVS